MSVAADPVDVVVIGCGPTGATLAGLCARRGLSVVVVEREPQLHALPRAVQCDHEVLRILQELGCADEVLAASIVNDGISFLTADRRTLLSVTVPPLAATGWPSSVFFHQPTFEASLRRAVRSAGAELRLGRRVVSLHQDADGVDVALDDGMVVRARTAVGCDGARSATRAVVGAALDDTGFEESWFVVDLVLSDDVPGLPTRCLQVCDPVRPHTLVPMPAPRFRFEFMLLPGETEEDVRRDDVIAAMLSSWIDPAAATVERSAVYTFHGLVASSWRDRRVFLAGDAAHQTPPFLGQGMCAGMRDAANLAWKLAAVLDGDADDALLDTYQGERRPHARAVIDAAVDFGRLICELDPGEAAARDEALTASYAGDTPAPDMIPPLGRGPAVGPGGGRPAAQPRIEGVPFDDRTGDGFVLCTTRPPRPGSDEARWWGEHGTVVDAATVTGVAALTRGFRGLRGPARPLRHGPGRHGGGDGVRALGAAGRRPGVTAVTARAASGP